MPIRGDDCVEVDRADGFVVIKDDSPEKPEAWLIVPDHEVTGIESPAVFDPPVATSGATAGASGAAAARNAPADRGLAINSEAGRSQDLLHIHISCVLPAVARRSPAPRRTRLGARTLPEARRRTTTTCARWRRSTRARSCGSRRCPGARADMGEQSLAVIGSADGGFFLITHFDRAWRRRRGGGTA